MYRRLALLFIVLYAFDGTDCVAEGHSIEGGCEPDYQKLITKLEVLETKITRVESASREQLSSLETKLDKVFKLIEKLSRSVLYPQNDGDAQQFNSQRHKPVHSAEQETPLRLAPQEKNIYESCDVTSSKTSQIEQLQPEPGFGEVFPVFCDQEYEAGGWIVIQNRFNGSVNFYRGWKEYKNGFGNLNGEFWLGLDKLHAITYSGEYELNLMMEDFENRTVVAKYSQFAIGGEHESFRIIKLGTYCGTAGDGLGYHRAAKFSTIDVNHDSAGHNGAVEWTGAWWYRNGHHSNLNGQYLMGPVDGTKYHGKGMTWNPFRGDDYSLKRSRMMIRRKMERSCGA